MRRNLKVSVVMSLLLGLVACGGGESAAADPLAEVPASASESSVGLTGYVDALAAMPSDTHEPVSVDRFNPARPDNTEPETVTR